MGLVNWFTRQPICSPMLHLLILIAMVPIALGVLRLVAAVIRGIIGLVLLVVFVCVIASSAAFTPSSHPGAASIFESPPAPIQSAALAIVNCTVDDKLDAGGIGEFCDRYYKGAECHVQIEDAFARRNLRLSPVEQCGNSMTPLPITPTLPESLDSIARAYGKQLPPEDFAQNVAALHELDPEQTALTLASVRNSPLIGAFLAFCAPSSQALEKIPAPGDQDSGSIVLDDLPGLEPFAGIVRGFYERNGQEECTTRLRDHSLCIQRKGAVSCNVFDWHPAPQEQVCIDYLIR
jgi:hypothetical protein